MECPGLRPVHGRSRQSPPARLPSLASPRDCAVTSWQSASCPHQKDAAFPLIIPLTILATVLNKGLLISSHPTRQVFWVCFLKNIVHLCSPNNCNLVIVQQVYLHKCLLLSLPSFARCHMSQASRILWGREAPRLTGELATPAFSSSPPAVID